MKFQEIYNSVIKLWPESIDISDGYFVDKKKVKIYFPKLSSIWRSVEEKISASKEWESLMVWGFFSIFIMKLRKNLNQKISHNF